MSVLVKSGGGEKRNARSAGTVASCHGNFESLVGKVTLANATPETILRGTVRMWGNGSSGTRPDVSRSIDFGTVTLSEQVATITVGHNLKVIPNM